MSRDKLIVNSLPGSTNLEAGPLWPLGLHNVTYRLPRKEFNDDSS